MEELAIKIDHVFKEYRLGTIGGGTLKEELQSKIARIRKKEDPNLKIGEVAHSKNEKFLALNDLSLEIKKGETIGIIGHNGAGKSTLLKLICRVTSPTKGKIYLNGRITSMLEVGTGFHGELTGRENIYLNGAILGMSKDEIDKKYDEIVEFSEIGQFIDTPVKRYSSGMSVKLGFSVASHLNSEIVIMDEVLAVGDVNFQNKCIERMKKLAEEEGRTILYVSHNMSTVKKLCERCIVLKQGKVIFIGDTSKAIEKYIENKSMENTTFFDKSNSPRTNRFNLRHKILSVELLNAKINKFLYGNKIHFRMRWKSENSDERVLLRTVIQGMDFTPAGVSYVGELTHNDGINQTDFIFDTSFLVPDKYMVDFYLYDEDYNGNIVYHDCATAMRFELTENDKSSNLKHWSKNWGNAILPCIKKIQEHSDENQ